MLNFGIYMFEKHFDIKVNIHKQDQVNTYTQYGNCGMTADQDWRHYYCD